MRKILPKIKFVDTMPLTDLESKMNEDKVLTGCFVSSTLEIYILKGDKEIRVLIHELCHWLIQITTKSSKIHKWFDKYFTVRSFKYTHQIKTQLETRKDRYRLIPV